MDKIRAYVKMRKATLEDFIWLDWEGEKRMKMGYPFYVLCGEVLEYRFVKLLDGEEKHEQLKLIKEWLSADRVFVLDPVFADKEKVKIEVRH